VRFARVSMYSFNYYLLCPHSLRIQTCLLARLLACFPQLRWYLVLLVSVDGSFVAAIYHAKLVSRYSRRKDIKLMT